MTNDTETKMVEINLCWEATVGVPTVDKEDGTLTWVEQELNPNMTSFKVKVPEEAVKSKRDLRRFLQQSAEDHDCDILSIGYETNIWDDEKEDFVFD